MSIWIFDENRADFRPALPGEIEADPDALYIIQRGDVLIVREDGHERPMPERLDVAGVMFDRESFEGAYHLQLESLIPNETTIAAISELEAGKGKRFTSVDDLKADLHAGEL